jgi:hypothetical protein
MISKKYVYVKKLKSYGTLSPGASYPLLPLADRKRSDSLILAGRVLVAAMAVVTAERVLMAVVLIVEDDVFIRAVAEMMIQDWGHQTLSASDVEEALSLLRSPNTLTHSLPISI